MKRRNAVTLVLSALTALVMIPVQAEETVLTFGIVSTESSQNLKQDWQPVLEDMSRKLGVKVNAYFASDYAGVIEAMRFNKVQMGWFGNKSAIEAVDRSNGEVFAQVVGLDGNAGYTSMVGVNRDSSIQNLSDLLKNAATLNFGIGDPNSTSGYLVPSYYVFAKNNVNPKTAFKTLRSANHEANILAIVNKQVDAAVFASDTYERITARQPDAVKQIRIIWESPRLPSDPLVYRKDLPAAMKQKIQEFFVTYGQAGSDAEREKKQLAKLTYSRFQVSTNAQLTPVRQLELFKEKVKVEADTTLSAQERSDKLEAISRKLNDLAKG